MYVPPESPEWLLVSVVSLFDEVEYSLIDSHFLSSEAVGLEEGFLEYEAQ